MSHNPDTVSALPPEERRLVVITAGHRGSPEDLELLNATLLDPDPFVRSASLNAFARLDQLTDQTVVHALADTDAIVRQRAAQLAPQAHGEESGPTLREAVISQLNDAVPLCVIASLGAIGTLGLSESIEAICRLADSHPDPLVVEEAIATLAELGDPVGLEVILSKATGKPALRRRVVAALGAFEGADVEAALDRLSQDRDWQVRQAVAMLRREELDEADYRTED